MAFMNTRDKVKAAHAASSSENVEEIGIPRYLLMCADPKSQRVVLNVYPSVTEIFDLRSPKPLPLPPDENVDKLVHVLKFLDISPKRLSPPRTCGEMFEKCNVMFHEYDEIGHDDAIHQRNIGKSIVVYTNVANLLQIKGTLTGFDADTLWIKLNSSEDPGFCSVKRKYIISEKFEYNNDKSDFDVYLTTPKEINELHKFMIHYTVGSITSSLTHFFSIHTNERSEHSLTCNSFCTLNNQSGTSFHNATINFVCGKHEIPVSSEIKTPLIENGKALRFSVANSTNNEEIPCEICYVSTNNDPLFVGQITDVSKHIEWAPTLHIYEGTCEILQNKESLGSIVITQRQTNSISLPSSVSRDLKIVRNCSSIRSCSDIHNNFLKVTYIIYNHSEFTYALYINEWLPPGYSLATKIEGPHVIPPTKRTNSNEPINLKFKINNV